MSDQPPNRPMSDAERKWRVSRNKRAQRTTSSIPGITGGQMVPNGNWSGAVNGMPFVWQAPGYTPPVTAPAPTTPPATTTPAPTTPGYTLPPATTSVPGPWNIPGTVTAPNIAPAQGTPTNAAGASSGWGDWMTSNGYYDPGYMGPGTKQGSASPWFYNPSEFMGTIGTIANGLPWNQDNPVSNPGQLQAGWYGAGVDPNTGQTRYYYGSSLEDIQNAGADTGLNWNPNRGMTQRGSTYSGGNASYWVGGQMGRGFRRMSSAQQDALRQAAPRLGLAGLGAILGRQTFGNSGPNLVSQIVNRTLAGVANGNNAPTQGSGTNTGWMGQMVGFNP